MAKVVTLNSEIINIGDWDEQIIDGEPTNPFPEGAIYEEKEIVLTADEKFVTLDSPTAYYDLRKAEYPSITDQLDAMWKGGAAATEMQQMVMAVKMKYPKPL